MSDLYDYSKWDGKLTKRELVCQHTGEENPNVAEFTALIDLVYKLRLKMGIPFRVSSAYRHPTHPIEAKKLTGPGQHTAAAIDIRVPILDCHRFMKEAFKMGFTGIGVNLTGEYGQRFIHLDLRETPKVWSY